METVQLKADGSVLFKCPLCGIGEITKNKRASLFSPRSRINPCPNCSAEFTADYKGNYRLSFCEPHRLLNNHRCDERIFRGCYLDLTLSASEWQTIAEGGESSSVADFLSLSTEYRKGKLPSYPQGQAPFTLQDREIIHHISSPVYMYEKTSATAQTGDKGELFVTNKRIVYVHPQEGLAIPLREVEQSKECFPGIIIKGKASVTPYIFFLPRNDPVFATICGAINNVKG